MLPGLIAGHYTFDESHIDLGPLARFAGARLYHDEVVSLDLGQQRAHCRDRPPVSYDVLSIDIGSSPDIDIPGANEHAIAVKPVSQFNDAWGVAEQRILAQQGAQAIGVVGAGAGGIELLLAIRHRLRTLLSSHGENPDRLSFHIVASSEDILPTHNLRARKKFSRHLQALGVELHLGEAVTAVQPDGVVVQSRTIPLDEVFWVTNASAPDWPASSGLNVSDAGFIQVDETLQSLSHPTVFAAGDIADVVKHPRPKSGVFAVRQGPVLSKNLRRAALAQKLVAFKPQREFLSLISTGDRYAIGSRGSWAIEGAWVWRLKNWIDRRFMRKFRELPEMETSAPGNYDAALAPDLLRVQADPMRCGGCGSKVGADVLSDALKQLELADHADVIVGLAEPDDAAIVRPHPNTVLVQTVDSFRAFIDDPYIFGRITANHCLSDIFAMGATPQTALAIVTLPLASSAKMRDDLVQLMSGALTALNETETALVGGHTNEGPEMALGFAINGYVNKEYLSQKGGCNPGDVLILTKPIGSGILLAGDMRGLTRSRDIEAAIASMLQSNEAAANCLREHGASAMTDVTGFGLAGHLLEMLRPSQHGASIKLDSIPILAAAQELSASGIRSSLHANNIRVEVAVEAGSAVRQNPSYAICFDPQTSGGLLASVPKERVQASLAALSQHGYSAAAAIGEVQQSSVARLVIC